MPKEVIRGDLLLKKAHVTVGWDFGSAQLAVGLGRPFVFSPKCSPKPEGWDDEEHNDLWFTFSDRNQINELIRNLRKARDKAFGRDE